MRTVLSRLGKLASNAAAMRTSLMQSPSMTRLYDGRIGASRQPDECKIKPCRHGARQVRLRCGEARIHLPAGGTIPVMMTIGLTIRPPAPRGEFPAPATSL